MRAAAATGGASRGEAPHIDTGTRAGASGTVVLLLLVPLVVLAAIPGGSMSLWSQSALFVGVAGLVALRALGAFRRGELVLVRTPLWWVAAAVAGVALLQCVPLPGGLVAALSPEAALAHQRSAVPSAMPEAAALSLSPSGTLAAFPRVLLLLGVFFLVVHSLQRRWQFLVAAGSVLAAALLQLGIAAVRGAAGDGPGGGMEALTGTFLEAGHLAALLVMAFGLTMGLWMAAAGAPARDGPGPVRSARSRRAWRLALLVCGLLLLVGIGFTRSHSGLLAALLAAVLFLLCLGIAARLRRSTLAVFALVVLVLAVGQFIALEVVVTWLEQDAPPVAPPWADRVDLYRSALAMASAFPVAGSGLGSFADVFPRFQSGRFGDAVVSQLPSDWLQLACELGLPGVLLVLIGGAWLVGATLRLASRCTDPLCRWLAVGGAVGATAAAAQAALDRTLAEVTANGVVFAALLGLAFAAARRAGADREAGPRPATHRVPLGGPALRALAAVGCVLMLIAVCRVPVRRALAEIAFNYHLAASGEPADPRFGLPVAPEVDPAAAAAWLDRALELDSDRPRHLEAAARRALARAGRDAPERADLERALGLLDRAVQLAPTRAEYRLERGRLRLLLARAQPTEENPNGWLEGASREMSLAMALAPNRPGVLYRAGSLMVELASRADRPQAREGCLAAATGGFRRALTARPDYAGSVYDLLLATERDPRVLFAATPETPSGYCGLLERLVAEEAWPESLSALEGLERLGEAAAEGRPVAAGIPAGPPDESVDVRIQAARRRAVIHGRLGQWRERAAAVRRLHALVEASLEPAVTAAEEHAVAGRHAAALVALRDVLARDPDHPRALLALARLAAHAELGDVRHLCPPPLEPLLRLVRARSPVPAGLFAQAARAAAALRPGTAGESRLARFVEAVAWLRAGVPARAGILLEDLARCSPEEAGARVDAHEVMLCLGRARAACGKRDAARVAYMEALERVPSYQVAREALARLDGSAVAVADPEMAGLVPVDVMFGDRVRLVGFRLHAGSPGGGPALRLTTRWESGDASLAGYSLRVSTPGREPEAVVSLIEDGRSPPAGARFTRTLALEAVAGDLELAVVKDRPAVGEEPILPTDALESALRLGTRRID